MCVRILLTWTTTNSDTISIAIYVGEYLFLDDIWQVDPDS